MSQTTRSDDSLLEERIEKIRKNNERIQRRYLEVEADKQNAAKLNALVQLSPPHEDEEPRFSHPRLPKKSERDVHEQGQENELSYSPRASAREHNRFGPSAQPYTSTKSHSFSQDDGPPPDPVYNFLADRQRDPRASSRGAPFQRGGRGNRGMPTQYRERTGPPETRGKFSRGRGRGSDGPHQHAYEMWKSERYQIDQERINRQKTAGGEWKREWDKEKVSEDVDNDWPPSAGQGRIPYRRDKHTLESYIPRDGGHPAGVNHPETNRDGKGVTRKKKTHDAASPFATQDKRLAAKSPKPERRIVKDLGISLQVSVKNDHAAAPPVQRVKVSPKNIAGTGRVGPRQQARMSYSSQSEDETVRVNTERKVPSKRQNKKYEQSPETKPLSGASTPSSKEKEVAHDASEANVTGASKPPLPPVCDSRTGNETPKPKRQILKAVRQRGQRNSTNKSYGTKSSDSDKKESSDDAKERSESGDDGWEDVTTTSGTESMSEDAVPSQMENSPCVVAMNDLSLSETKEVSEANYMSKTQNNSEEAVMPSEGTDHTEMKMSDIDNLCSSTADQSTAENHGKTACDSNHSTVVTETLSDINNLCSSSTGQSTAESCGNAPHDSTGSPAVDAETVCTSDSGLSPGDTKQEELLNSAAVEIQQNETGNPNCCSTDAETIAVESKETDLATPEQSSKGSEGKMDEK
ncbi:uncharacterized protein LOC124619483 [Schistocerca americana]|uniref:uncharacterized protein LOC124619483 n=1 Tax=Schistocerca americana TaxID=7009 RepID=UPI001F4F81B7|nr:uncharacterized protein LOC124619483 [Schistocerca americana]